MLWVVVLGINRLSLITSRQSQQLLKKWLMLKLKQWFSHLLDEFSGHKKKKKMGWCMRSNQKHGKWRLADDNQNWLNILKANCNGNGIATDCYRNWIRIWVNLMHIQVNVVHHQKKKRWRKKKSLDGQFILLWTIKIYISG